MNFKKAFLTQQIITYLGNKRKLLPAIYQEIKEIIKLDKTLEHKLKTNEAIFYDAFSGSGIVARLAREMGLRVCANDLESYAYPINKSFLEITEAELEKVMLPVYNWLCSKYQLSHISGCSYEKIIKFLNTLENPKVKYFSTHYAPKDTNNPCFDSERLFYTQENARKLDCWSEIIHDPFMTNHSTAKSILAASVLYVMGKQINTSGVMKGFHNGWGGRSGAALGRILSTMVLETLPLSNNICGKAYQGDATETLKLIDDVDIIYADPPYNQHQYGANYHLLTTFWNNDKYDPGPVDKGTRAGIRTDHNRSKYAQAKAASAAFSNFVNEVNKKAKYVIVSYNNEGLIAPDEMLKILSNDYKNNIKVVPIKHDKFKGGKSTQTSNQVVEYLFIACINKNQSKAELRNISESLSSITKKTIFVDSYVDPTALKELFSVEPLKKGWCVKNDYGWYAVINKNRKITEASSQSLPEKEQKLLLDSTLTKEELLNIYILEKNWNAAIKTLKAFKLKRDLDIFKRNAIIIRNALKLEKNEKMLEKITSLYQSILKEKLE